MRCWLRYAPLQLATYPSHSDRRHAAALASAPVRQLHLSPTPLKCPTGQGRCAMAASRPSQAGGDKRHLRRLVPRVACKLMADSPWALTSGAKLPVRKTRRALIRRLSRTLHHRHRHTKSCLGEMVPRWAHKRVPEDLGMEDPLLNLTLGIECLSA